MRHCHLLEIFKGVKYIKMIPVQIAQVLYEPWHEISKRVVCATSKVSDQPAHTLSLFRAFASRMNIL